MIGQQSVTDAGIGQKPVTDAGIGQKSVTDTDFGQNRNENAGYWSLAQTFAVTDVVIGRSLWVFVMTNTNIEIEGE